MFLQEPHPADDLSGRDVARKLTILARLASPSTAGLPDGFASIDTQSLVPPTLADVKDPAAFVDGLAVHDEVFERLRSEAESEGKVLRYVGLLDRATGTIKCGLEKLVLSRSYSCSIADLSPPTDSPTRTRSPRSPAHTSRSPSTPSATLPPLSSSKARGTRSRSRLERSSRMRFASLNDTARGQVYRRGGN